MAARNVTRYRAAEFFAGAGLVGAALEAEGVMVAWANDIDPMKERVFTANCDASVFHLGDVHEVMGHDIPPVELATASFPCIDLSLAGNRRGLDGKHSGTFWEFARVLKEMDDRKPRVVLLENVSGFATSNGGEDLRLAMECLNGLGYVCDLLLIDAKHFVPQSRPRLFIVGSIDRVLPEYLGSSPLRPPWFNEFAARNASLQLQTLALEAPSHARQSLSSVVERLPHDDARWWDGTRADAFLSALSPLNSARVAQLAASQRLTWRTAYRRTRDGRPMWEVRADAIAGCLRTARGGSSKQAVVEAGRGEVRVRWMTAREYARLQGVPEYSLGGVTESQAMSAFGDAVCVPAVRWLLREYVLPLLAGNLTEPGRKQREV